MHVIPNKNKFRVWSSVYFLDAAKLSSCGIWRRCSLLHTLLCFHSEPSAGLFCMAPWGLQTQEGSVPRMFCRLSTPQVRGEASPDRPVFMWSYIWPFFLRRTVFLLFSVDIIISTARPQLSPSALCPSLLYQIALDSVYLRVEGIKSLSTAVVMLKDDSPRFPLLVLLRKRMQTFAAYFKSRGGYISCGFESFISLISCFIWGLCESYN